MSINSNFNFGDAFGFHTSHQIFEKHNCRRDHDCSYKLKSETLSKYMNIGKVLGYIPVVGTIIAIAKFSTLKSTHFPSPSFRAGSIVRAALELTSLGILWLIPDLIVSIGRAITTAMKPKQSTPEAKDDLLAASEGLFAMSEDLAQLQRERNTPKQPPTVVATMDTKEDSTT